MRKYLDDFNTYLMNRFSGMYLFILVVDTFFPDRVRLQTYMFIGWGKFLLYVSLIIIKKFNRTTVTQSGNFFKKKSGQKIRSNPNFNCTFFIFDD